MKISLTFSGKTAETFKFTADKQLLIYITNIFKIGVGFKYRTLSPEEKMLPCVDKTSGKPKRTLGRESTTKVLRVKYWNIKSLPWLYHTVRYNVMTENFDAQRTEDLEEYNKTIMEGING